MLISQLIGDLKDNSVVGSSGLLRFTEFFPGLQ